MMSVAFQTPDGPLEVLRWSPTKWRKAEAMRDRVMRGQGTAEPWVVDPEWVARTAQWRKPLTIEEVAQMAQTPAVRRREGRP